MGEPGGAGVAGPEAELGAPAGPEDALGTGGDAPMNLPAAMPQQDQKEGDL